MAKKIEILVNDLTEEQVMDIAYYGEKYGCTYKDYEAISEVWRGDELVAKVYNKHSIYIDNEN
jgi:hypothetical protein